MNNFWKDLASRGKIVALAPMDGYTDSAYRQIVKKINPEVICFSEFFSADGIVHSKFLANSVLPHHITEKPLIIQIFGKDPEIFRKAAIIIESYGVAGIDVNMGCPAKKVVQSGHGSSLMINVDTAYRIIEEMAKAVKIPISVKTRLGYADTDNLIPFAKGLENAGAQLITVHGRTFKQAFTGQADWSMIYELKKNLGIPVIGNGDVVDFDDGMNKVENLDGFMIGRKSFGNPWCFLPGKIEPTLGQKLDTMKEHAKLLIELKGRKGCLEARKHLAQYLHSFPGVKHYRGELVRVESFENVEKVLEEIRNDFKDGKVLI
ncbi:MAG: tRNA-dihydrouridine synthase [Candidatus Gracilibacteria bacterium]|nr:tRNA-dihydrouridine synthase [Candidatus Gracilibacteria bacterium]MDD2908262.1 tRNA-dihydrouridine synthase [Candidatus Gracilibacteria bacterium]